MKKNGILNKKLKTYYGDVNLKNYRQIFLEAIINYNGDNFCNVLDIGVGIGSFLESIKPFGYNSYALEASEYGVKTCLEKGINCQSFFLEQNRQLPFENNKFSLVVFNQVIEHLEKEVGKYYIKEIIRVLEPGGVAIIKSPSTYSKIWRTDPHHLYCWKPNELYDEVEKYNDNLSDIILQRVTLEPWMFFEYNEKIIDTWHKYNRYPKIKRIFALSSTIADKILNKLTKTDRLLAVSNVTFVKKI